MAGPGSHRALGTPESEVQRKLPPGQKLLDHSPRYGLFQYANRIDIDPAPLALEISGDLTNPIVLGIEFMDRLQRVDRTSDFHCITTWSRQGINWSGVRFKDFFERIVLPEAGPAQDIRYVVFSSRDDYRTYFVLEDVLAEDVLLADRLEGEPLSWEHGAPLRLVAPAHYGFKSPKYLQKIEFCEVSPAIVRPPCIGPSIRGPGSCTKSGIAGFPTGSIATCSAPWFRWCCGGIAGRNRRRRVPDALRLNRARQARADSNIGRSM